MARPSFTFTRGVSSTFPRLVRRKYACPPLSQSSYTVGRQSHVHSITRGGRSPTGARHVSSR
ncbi:hypothetical protein [Herbidospora daliensis]|uniref:hypothetical protein n=1 Tax=Herbidospora daliensis TaxID=295585 RepID=UPI000AB4BF24|nr:hypothetical protein [Herbidospora daliensis]